MTLVLLGIGGALGAVARYALASWIHRLTGATFPWGTLTVNVLGSFLLGLVVTGLDDSPFRLYLGALLAAGFLGDFTTFSTYSYETVMLARQRDARRTVMYVAGTAALSVLAVVAGMLAGAGFARGALD